MTIEVFYPELYQDLGSPAFSDPRGTRAALASDAVGELRNDVLSLLSFYSIQLLTVGSFFALT